MIIHKLALWFASYLVKNKLIEKASQDVYTYGFELILSATTNILLMALISIAFCCYYDWVLFLAAFIPLRTTAGGYHASSHLRCIMVGTIVYTILLLITQLHVNWAGTAVAIVFISFLLILVLSPVEVQNKKLNTACRMKNRRLSVCFAIINMLMAMFIFFIDGFLAIFDIYFAGVFAAALSMLAVKAKRQEKKRVLSKSVYYEQHMDKR